MRYLWDLYPAYRNDWTRSRSKRGLMTVAANYLRLWDFAAAARVDEFVANSENVRRRIWKTYRRDSQVVRPPVNVENFYWKPPGDYHLIVSELVPYKRVDAAIRAFNQSGRKLRVVGEGPEYKALRRSAAANIEFCGRATDEDLRELYAGCQREEARSKWCPNSAASCMTIPRACRTPSSAGINSNLTPTPAPCRLMRLSSLKRNLCDR